MTKPIYEPTQQRQVANHGWRVDQLERRPTIGTLGVAIDSTVTYGVSIKEVVGVIYRNIDSNAYWDNGTCVTAIYTWNPSAILTNDIPGVAIGPDPDTAADSIFLDSNLASTFDPEATSPIALLWQIQTPMYEARPELAAATGLTSVYARATLFAYDGSANSFVREQTDQIFEPHFEDESEQKLLIGLVGDFLAANPAITGSDPAAPLRVTYFVTVRWFIDVPFADWVPGDEDDIALANFPLDTRFYVNLLAQVTP